MNPKKIFKMSRILHLDNKPLDPAIREQMEGLSDVDRFDLFLKQDLRLPSSRKFVSFNTRLQLDLLRFRLLRGAESLKKTKNLVNDLMEKYSIPLPVLAVFSLPFFTYYMAHPEVHNNYKYRLHTGMQGLAMVVKTPGPMDWSSVVGNQFYHQIDWNDVGISDYRNDSVFVLFSPKLSFIKKEQYIACCETEQYYPPEQKLEQSPKQTDSKTIDLVKLDENSYGPKSQLEEKIFNPLKKLKKHLLQPLKDERALARHREKAKICPEPVQEYLNAKQKEGPFGDFKSIQTIPIKELRKILRPKRKGFGFGKAFQNSRNIHITHYLPICPDSIKVGTASPFPAAITNLIASRDHHILITPDHVEKLIKIVNPEKSTETMESTLFWQPYFNSFDLIPSKMESMTFANKPRLGLEQQYRQDMKTFDKDSRSVDSSYIIPSHKTSREKRKTLYEKQLRDDQKAYEKFRSKPASSSAQAIFSLERELKPNSIKLLETPTEQNNLLGLKTKTVRNAKHNLVAENRHQTMDWHTDNPYSIDQLSDSYKHRKTLKANWKYRIKQRYMQDRPEWWAQIQPQIDPLFDVSKKNSVAKLKYVETTVDESKLAKQDPASKIFLLSEAIQENFHKALESKIAVRQSSRYLVFNSLFNVNHLINRNLYIGKKAPRLGKAYSFETKPLDLKQDYIFLNSKKTPAKFRLKCFKPSLLYETLLEDRHWFNPYENFPYHKVNESKGIHKNVFQPGELNTESSLQHREKVLCADAKRTVRYGLTKKSGKRKKGKTQSKLNKTNSTVLKNTNKKLLQNQKPVTLTEFKLKNIGLLEKIIKQKLARKQKSMDRILEYAKVVFHPFFNKTKPEIQKMIDVRNTSNLKKLKKINDQFEAETFGKIKKIQKELTQMQKSRETYYTKLIELLYSFQETVNETFSELKKDPKLPNYFYGFPGDNIEIKNYEKQQKEMIARLEKHPIFEFLRSQPAPDEQVYLKREKALLEMCHSKWRNEPFAK